MKFFSLLPLNIRLAVFAALAVFILGGGLFAKYVFDDWRRLKHDNKVQTAQIALMNGYIERLDKWTKIKEKGKQDGAAKIRTYKNEPVNPVIADTVHGLPVYSNKLPR